MPDSGVLLQDSTTPQIKVAGRDRPELARDVVALDLEEDVEGMKRLRFDLTAIGPQQGARDEVLLHMNGDPLCFGAEIELSLGQRSNPVTVFKGKLSGLELVMQQGRDPEVRVFAEDRLMDLRMTRRFKTYEDASDADILQQIASKHGLQGQADVEGPTFDAVQQWNQSDLAFLRHRAAQLQADIWVEDNTLHMASRERRKETSEQIRLVQGNDLLAVEIRADLAHQRTAVHVGGYDAQGKEGIDEEADAAALASEATGGKKGADVLNEAFGERVSWLVREVPVNSNEARERAKAEATGRGRRFITVHGVTLGTPKMTVGSQLTLERVGKLFEGSGYYVTRVLHCFDRREGYRTHFEAERAWIGNAS